MSTNEVPPALVGRWRLHHRVALRPEPFGALAYHYGNRRLNFLRSADLVNVVERLGNFSNIAEALEACQIDRARHSSFQRALATLAASDFLEPATLPRNRTEP